MSNPVILIDTSNLMHRAFHGYPLEAGADGFPSNAIRGVIQVLLRLEHEFPGAQMVAVFDRGVDEYRKGLLPGYKANRKPTDRALKTQINGMVGFFPYLGVASVRPARGEADDVIFTLARKYEKEGREVLIYGSDKDLLQCVTDKIHVLRPAPKERPPWTRFDAEVTKREFGVTPSQIAEYLAIVGDSSDEIAGVPSVGPKKAADLFAMFNSADEIISYGQSHDDNPVAKTVAMNSADVVRFAKVTRLRTIPIADPVWRSRDMDLVCRELASLGLSDLTSKFPQ